MASGGNKRYSEATRRKIEIADQDLAEQTSISDLVDSCKATFGLASKIMLEIKRGKFQKIEGTQIVRQEIDFMCFFTKAAHYITWLSIYIYI